MDIVNILGHSFESISLHMCLSKWDNNQKIPRCPYSTILSEHQKQGATHVYSALVRLVDDPLADLLHVDHLPPLLLRLHPRYLVHVLPETISQCGTLRMAQTALALNMS